MKLPQGFRSVGVRAGLKASGKLDLSLIYSADPLVWSLTTTRNLLQAACVTRNRVRLDSTDPVHAVVINSGNANCATGDQGVTDNTEMAQLVADALDLPSPDTVLTASTGIIGQHLDMAKLREQIPNLSDQLGDDTDALAKAILTTDLVSKTAEVTLPGGGRIVGVAKGSGMIHPNMATMLAFVMTDVVVDQDALRTLWSRIVADSFNQVTVDGDTSPNDMALVLSSGRVSADAEAFMGGLEHVAQDLAKQIARDGEGATKLLTVRVRGADSITDARAAARTVASSSLFKAALHGNDPNRGPIVSAVGRSNATIDMDRLRVSVQDVVVYHGLPQPFDAKALSHAMDTENVIVDIDLAVGDKSASAWGCDLSKEYVTINAEYHT